MNIYLGYFDFVLVVILILANYRFWKKFSVFDNCLITIIFISLFGFILPIISMFFEIQLNSSSGDDAFNLLYTFFRFPFYWAIGIIQLIIIGAKINNLK